MSHISEPPLNPSITVEAKNVLKLANIVLSDWQKEVSIGRESEDTISIYDCFPYLFIEAFPNVSNNHVQKLALAGRFYASALFLSDALMDQEWDGVKTVVASINTTVLQFEANRLLSELFPSDSSFWTYFKQYMREYTEACFIE